jgi:hypothetical protein
MLADRYFGLGAARETALETPARSLKITLTEVARRD